jgi:competence protein ComEC
MEMNILKFILLLLPACATPLTLENQREVETAETVPPQSPLKILVLDVGQGDATLIVGPTGRGFLIDTGPEELGEEKILPTLKKEGIERLDALLLSHFDIDHIGSAASLLKEIHPPLAILDRGDSTQQDHPLYLDYLKQAQGHRQKVAPGEVFELGSEAKATVVVVGGLFANGDKSHLNPDEENEASIGRLIEYGLFRYFTAGDLAGGGAPGGYETKNLEDSVGDIIGDIDILHLSHHGSDSSSQETFLDKTTPEVAVVSVGTDNPYHHPAEEVINRLEENSINLYRTDRDGDIAILSDGERYRILNGR